MEYLQYDAIRKDQTIIRKGLADLEENKMVRLDE